MTNEETNTNGNEQQQDFYPLDEAALSLLNEIDQQMSALNAQWQGALILFLRQHKLAGNWRLAPNRRELQRMPEGVPAMQQR